ncbi:alkaline phosphatase [Citricoccus sp. SGAir0253]|uniref:alkaline phosphatase D family protein n=1 Tax=Citricoccus sp. SGAir0253 TaxID=2567881 RepID=UPI0010CD3301|nr:alkaline phosphatase D family protein [Citricoccus sp. SGAir0253]QCU78206.1 alkaline phosphatase [Citricoccus sp. SGAir0253]
MTQISRRSLLLGSAATAAAASLAAAPATAAPRPAAALVRSSRLTLPSGIATGDVTSRSAVLWSRASGAGRLVATVRAVDAEGRPLARKDGFERVLRGSWASEATDFTAKISAGNLPAGTRFQYTLRFEDEDGNLSESGTGTFSTAPGAAAHGRSRGRGAGLGRRGQSFVWTADTAGQGWGINEEIGGMRGYRAMLETAPDFFVHAGDTVYADGPIQAEVVEPDGQVWRNLVTEEVSKVAETLNEFRGRHRYTMMDANVRAMYAQVPLVAQWDDHETTNNWWHGETIDDPRYTVRDVDTLAARGRRAWQEYMPIADARALRPGTGFEPARIYRKIERGPQLDLFALDMRTHKGENTDGLEPHATALLGEEQVQWLIREVTTSKATWKVISCDLPLGIIVPDGKGQESISNAEHGAPLGRELELARVLKAFKDHGVKNVVFITGDVHYCAAHHYSPERAAFTDFDPFWEFVAGPINAGSFGPNTMDGTFGPEVVFAKSGDYANESPRDGEGQFFGHVDLDEDDTFTVSLRDANGTTVYSKVLRPER